ncbi:MAG: cyclophilin-like fold protein [Armatimonadota bacterium]
MKQRSIMVATLAVLVTAMTVLAPRPSETFSAGAQPMKIRFMVSGRAITATLVDSATARDFASLLPLTVTLEDYARTEKIRILSRRLSTEGTPPGYDPSPGDIAYYAPWGNLAVFYRDSGYAAGLVLLGKVDSGMEAFEVPGSVRVTIELLR